MSSKNQVLRMIELHSEKFINSLKLSHCSIRWHVLHSEDKNNGFDSKGCVAQMIYDTKKKVNRAFDIIIYYDKQKGKKDILGSIFHELLHVRMRQWDRVIRKERQDRAHTIEEKLVSDIEKIIIDLL